MKPKLIMLFFVFSLFFVSVKTYAADVTADTVYVIQVKTHTNVRVVESAKKSLMTRFPDRKFIIRAQSPNYTLSIGYFATEAEAEEFKKQLEKEYPDSKVLPIEKK